MAGLYPINGGWAFIGANGLSPTGSTRFSVASKKPKSKSMKLTVELKKFCKFTQPIGG